MKKAIVLLLMISVMANVFMAYGSASELVKSGVLSVSGYSSQEGASYQVIPVDGRVKVIEITPYEVDTKILRDEFEAFKIQYAVIWTLLGGGLIYAVSHR
ncbi:MAG: hypothetical protein AABZ57_06150 [Candidatus Margulisiibacteriota bacterium]